MANVKCPNCGANNTEQVDYNQYECPYCGHSFSFIEDSANESVEPNNQGLDSSAYDKEVHSRDARANMMAGKEAPVVGKTSKKYPLKAIIGVVGLCVIVIFLICALSLFPFRKSLDKFFDTPSIAFIDTQETTTENLSNSSVDNSIEDQPAISILSSEEIDSQSSVALEESEDLDESGDLEDDIYQACDQYEYEGVIDNTLNVTISLTRFDLEITGSYYYNKYGPDNHLDLRGGLNGDDFREFELDEYNSKGKHIGVFKGEIIGDYEALKGTYTLLSKDKKMSFSAKLKMHSSNYE